MLVRSAVAILRLEMMGYRAVVTISGTGAFTMEMMMILECMRKPQKAVDVTENRNRAPVVRRRFFRPDGKRPRHKNKLPLNEIKDNF